MCLFGLGVWIVSVWIVDIIGLWTPFPLLIPGTVINQVNASTGSLVIPAQICTAVYFKSCLRRDLLLFIIIIFHVSLDLDVSSQ